MKRVIVVGAGPAGVSAALYARSRGCDVTVFEAEAVGGLIGKVSKVSHFASCVVDETGPHFAERMIQQLEAANIPVRFERVSKVCHHEDRFEVITKKNSYAADKVIIATGSEPKELPIDCPENVRVRHFALGEEDRVKDRVVVMNGGSDGAIKEALYLAKFAKTVHIVQDQPQLLCIDEFRRALDEADNIEIHLGTKVQAFETEDDTVRAVRLANGDMIEDDAGIDVFVLIGQAGYAEPVAHLLDVEGDNFIAADSVETEIPGLYVAGDVRTKTVRQVATAVSDGCLAGILAAK